MEKKALNYEELLDYWENLCAIQRLTSNDYRILFEIALHGETTQKSLCTKRKWKVSSVSNTVRKLEALNLLSARAEQGSIYYFVNKQFNPKEE